LLDLRPPQVEKNEKVKKLKIFEFFYIFFNERVEGYRVPQGHDQNSGSFRFFPKF